MSVSTHLDDRTWYIIPCPSNVKLTNVDKERGTHGSVYVLWDIDERSPVWVGQSIPALVRSVNEKAVINKEKRLHASSLYRVLRGEARKRHHKSWRVSKYAREDLTELNTFLSDFCSVVYCSKSPELWRCKTADEVENQKETQSSEDHQPAIIDTSPDVLDTMHTPMMLHRLPKSDTVWDAHSDPITSFFDDFTSDKP